MYMCLIVQSCPTLYDPMDCSLPGSSLHGASPGKNTGVACHAHFSYILQGIFPSQGLNPGLPHCRQILYHLSYQGSPKILKWIVYSFSRGSVPPRNWTGVSCIAGRFFTSWATREAHMCVCVCVCVCVHTQKYIYLCIKSKKLKGDGVTAGKGNGKAVKEKNICMYKIICCV